MVKGNKPVTPTHVRKGCVAKSTNKSPQLFPEGSHTTYGRLSPGSKKTFCRRAKKTLDLLEDAAKEETLNAQRNLFGNAAGSSAEHTKLTPKKKTNRKGDVIEPDSPDCGLSPTNPGRDGSRSSRRIQAYSPDPKAEPID